LENDHLKDRRDNINIHVMEVEFEDDMWMQLPQGRVQCRSLVWAVLILVSVLPEREFLYSTVCYLMTLPQLYTLCSVDWLIMGPELGRKYKMRFCRI